MPWCKPVSYTHLDVYKRQVVDTAAAVRAGNPGKGSDASFDFIIERVSSSRAVRLQHCYEEIGMEQPLSTQWQKYEFIYYREADYMLGRTGEADYHYLIDFRQTTMPAQPANCTYTYTDENGDTQTYQMSDYKFWIDNISVVELENVYDMDNAENTALKVAYNGNIVSSADFLSSLNNGAAVSYTHLDVYKRQDICSVYFFKQTVINSILNEGFNVVNPPVPVAFAVRIVFKHILTKVKFIFIGAL